MTSQGVVERASAELSKRINGLTLRAANKPSSSGGGGGGGTAGGATTGSPSRTPRTGASVMERVTNVLCGGGTGGGSGGLGSGGSAGGIQYPRFRGRTPVRRRQTRAFARIHVTALNYYALLYT